MSESAPQDWVKRGENDDGDGLTEAELSALTELAEKTEPKLVLGPLSEPPSQ